MLTILLVLFTPFARSQATPGDADSLIIHFAYNNWTLSSQARSTIDSYLAASKTKGGTPTVSLSGYCDDRGTSQYNDQLSLRRAMAVKQYLIGRGLDSAKIIAVAGFGAKDPVDKDTTAAARANNRRVVLLFDTPPPAVASKEPVQASIDTAISELPKRPYIKAPSIRLQLADTSIHVGSKLILKNVNFFPGEHVLLPGCTIILDTLVQALKDNPNMRIHIDGYICCSPDGTEGGDITTHQRDLSIQRARYVYEYLVDRHIAKDRLAYAGHGASNKLYPEEKTPAEQELNRRVEITVVAK